MSLMPPAPGNRVELFDIDTTPIDAAGSILRITPATDGLAEIARDGNTYTACPVAAEGFERGGTGALPSPTLVVANVGQILGPWVEGAQDLIGAEVTRTVVLADWLDGEPGADPAAAITVDMFVIAQKSVQDQTKLSFVLRSPLDVRRQVPFRKALPRCTHSYRTWDSVYSLFDNGSCPYGVGPGSLPDPLEASYSYYNVLTAPASPFPTTDPGDVCSKSPQSCKTRFGNRPLPFKGFPSL